MNDTNNQKGLSLGDIPDAPDKSWLSKKVWFEIYGFWIGIGILFILLELGVVWGIYHLRYIYAKKKAESAAVQIELTPTSFAIKGDQGAIQRLNNDGDTQRRILQTWLTFREAMPRETAVTRPAGGIARARMTADTTALPRANPSVPSQLHNTGSSYIPVDGSQVSLQRGW